MIPVRVIPVLLLDGTRLVKTVKFKNPTYVGDPRIAVKIFNEKEVDELILLDISATPRHGEIQYDLIAEIVSEAFMPVCYGGGITDEEQLRRIICTGVEKVALNTKAIREPTFVQRISERFGSSTIVISIDARKNFFGKYEVVTVGGRTNTKKDPRSVAAQMQSLGAGEILINSIDQDGERTGYNLDLIRMVTGAVDIPVISCGGAGRLEDLRQAVFVGGASAVAAGSFFIFHGKHRAVLISYPSQDELKVIFAGLSPNG